MVGTWDRWLRFGFPEQSWLHPVINRPHNRIPDSTESRSLSGGKLGTQCTASRQHCVLVLPIDLVKTFFSEVFQIKRRVNFVRMAFPKFSGKPVNRVGRVQ